MTWRPPLAEQLDLVPHPEGGWFRQTWRSAVSFSPEGYSGPRSAATAIYFLLHPGEQSCWHVVRSDEMWFWHSGGPLELRMGGAGDDPSGGRAVVLGCDFGAGQQPQALVPGGVWQCAAPAGHAPVLVSCVVAPGFDFDDFRLDKQGEVTMTRSQRDRVIAECGAKPGAVEDYPFGDEVAVFKVAGKMFALVSLGLPPGSISLKSDPDVAVELRAEYPAITAGYHLSKRHWNTVTLDGSVAENELVGLIDTSYELVVAGLTRAERKKLT